MLNQAEIATTIKSIPWFLELSPESIQRLCAVADVQSFCPNDVIFSEGEQHSYLYIILEGKVSVESYVPGYGPMPIFTAESLDVIGWSSLTPVVRQKTGTARILEPTRLLAFEANALMELCESDCDLGFIIMRRLANIVASRLLTHRLHLLELITGKDK
ncbi:MAG: cyclic nucleotide-binding domain-containing protein [Chloroflexota bacterium]|jgi:CRP-like cAMP-binding protein|nr:cyclic nucleotide-binding domain-containing protein [Chloroflexota bacterium]